VPRVVILGRGASGKSTLATHLGKITGLPVIELDKHFWHTDLTPAPLDEWAQTQRDLVDQANWIMDGDLGPYDVLDVRLRAADTVILLDFSLARCAWRALRRSRERADFWHWLITYRRRSRPALLNKIATHAPLATLHNFRGPRALRRFLTAMQT
jgi:adenylate kinase family enzyme